jgi:hypothetical protein
MKGKEKQLTWNEIEKGEKVRYGKAPITITVGW